MFEIQTWKLIGAECTRWGGDGPVWLLWAGRDLRLGLFRRREAAACPSPYTQLFYTLYTFLYCCSFMLKYVHLCAGRRSSPLSKRRSLNCMPFAHTVFLYCFHPFYPFTFLFSNMYNCAILGWKSSIWASLEDESLLQWKQVSERKIVKWNSPCAFLIMLCSCKLGSILIFFCPLPPRCGDWCSVSFAICALSRLTVGKSIRNSTFSAFL